jgi:L-ascorbate metabolism protein UlaG (beta-lactamase superfamily)
MIRDGQVGLTWLGQSGFVLRFASATVLIDAFLSPHRDRMIPAPFAPNEAKGFDIVACTHEHSDHLDLEALPSIAEASPHARLVIPEPCVEMVMAAGIPANRLVSMQPSRPVQCCGLTLHAVAARHGLHPGDAYNFGEELSSGLIRYLGYAIRAGRICVYHSGDTIDFEGLADRIRDLHVDIALLPINGRDSQRETMDIVGNLDAVEAAQLAADSGVKVVVPMHHDMFAANSGVPERLVEAVRLRHPGLTVVIPARGVEIVFTCTDR